MMLETGKHELLQSGATHHAFILHCLTHTCGNNKIGGIKFGRAHKTAKFAAYDILICLAHSHT